MIGKFNSILDPPSYVRPVLSPKPPAGSRGRCRWGRAQLAVPSRNYGKLAFVQAKAESAVYHPGARSKFMCETEYRDIHITAVCDSMDAIRRE